MQLAALVLIFAQAAPAVAGSAPQPAPTGPVVALEILQGGASLGRITIVLDREKAPVTVENFLKYVRARHYDGTIFHRVIPTFMIQGGNLTPDLEERPNGPAIPSESNNGRRNARGTVAMARTTEPNSATDQFFINLKDNHRLDYGISGAGYAVFGQVIEGMDVVDAIALTPTTSRGGYENVPQVSVIIESAREMPSAPPPAAVSTAPTTSVPRPDAPKP